jgi:hypothetical protein
VAGRYQLSFDGRIRDYTWEADRIPRPTRLHRACPIESPSRPIEFVRREE